MEMTATTCERCGRGTDEFILTDDFMYLCERCAYPHVDEFREIRVTPPSDITLRPYQVESIAKITEELRQNQSTLLVMATGLGKAQPDDSPVLGLWGWERLGDLCVGDYVIGVDGQPTKVIGVFPQGEKPIFDVRFSDGTSTRCCGEHLWSVHTKSQKHRTGQSQIKDTASLVGDLTNGDGSNKWFIPVCEPVAFVWQETTIDPYLLGVLLGDGGIAHAVTVSSADKFILEAVGEAIKPLTLKRLSQYDYRITHGIPKLRNPIQSDLRDLGLFGKMSHDKFIPKNYLYNTVDTRLAVLRGLMDTDGHVRPSDGHCEFSTVSRRLADDVCELVRSLGGVTRVRTKKPGNYTHKGEYKTGKVSYRVTVSIADNPFLLPRKASLHQSNRNQGRTKAIISIEPAGVASCRCISVADQRGLYLTNDYTVTHNTVVFSALARDWPDGRVLVVAHRDELIQQAADKIASITGEQPAIEMGESRSNEDSSYRARVVITSVQTMSREKRIKRFNPNDFGLVIIDEAHHAVASTYLFVVEYFQQHKKLKLLGVTATPDRADEEALGRVFESVAYEYEIPNAINDGYLVPIEQQFVFVDGLDFSQVRTTAGDLNAGDLERILVVEEMIHKFVTPTIEMAGDAPTLVFTASVAHAERTAEIFNRHRSGCAVALSGTTDIDIRRREIERFKAGDTQFLVNCGLFLEGFDAPATACVAVARPTKSRALYTQIVGRGTRPLPGVIDGIESPDGRRDAIRTSGKPSLLVLDYVGNSGRHKLVTTADVLGGNVSDEIVAQAAQIAAAASRKGSKVDMLAAIKEATEKAEELARKRRQTVVAKAKYNAQSVNPFDVFDLTPQREPGWFKGKLPTERMKEVLRNSGIDPDKLSFFDARRLIGEIISRREHGLCSYKQSKLLTKHGFDGKTSFDEAKKIIDRIAASGWKLRGPLK